MDVQVERRWIMKKFNLKVVKNELSKTSDIFIKGIQEEIVKEEQEALKDFVKGAYRLSLEKEKEVKKLEAEIKDIRKAIDNASKGQWSDLGAIKIPARFFDEKTLRKHGHSLLSGNSEIRFLDLYGTDTD